MSIPSSPGHSRRETRLLLVTLAVSAGVLLLLARFRFPADPAAQPQGTPAPAPLERLAARAAYEELASTMADLERRIVPRVTVLRTRRQDGGSSLIIAPRLTSERAVALSPPDDVVEGSIPGEAPDVIFRDRGRSLTVLRAPAGDENGVLLRQSAPRPGPRYVAVLEGTAAGAALRPVYVGRTEVTHDARTGMQLLSMTGVPETIGAGTAVFSLDAALIGLVRDAGDPLILVSAESLRMAVEGAQPAAAPPNATLGLEVDTLTAPLARATGTTEGVVVVRAHPAGPAHGKLVSGDVIQTLAGTPVRSVLAFRQIEGGLTPGAEVPITGSRRRTPLSATIRAADAAATAPAAGDDPGFVGVDVPGAGVEIVTVREGSAAASAGLERGDLVVGVDGEAAPRTTAVVRRFRRSAPGSALLLSVQRGQDHRVLALEKR